MGFIYFIAAAALAVGSHVVLMQSSRFSDANPLSTILFGILSYLAAHFFRLFLMGLFLVYPSSSPLDIPRILSLIPLSALHTVCLITFFPFATQIFHTSLPRPSRVFALSLGYSLANSVFSALPDIWRQARSPDFSPDALFTAVAAVATLASVCAAGRALFAKAENGKRTLLIVVATVLCFTVSDIIPELKDLALMWGVLARIASAGLLWAFVKATVKEEEMQ